MTTPGPWEVSPTKRPQGFPIVIITAQGLQVAAVNASPDDAALMAAAPALMAALRELVQGVHDEFSCSHPLREAADRARAVISQAQQGQQTKEV